MSREITRESESLIVEKALTIRPAMKSIIRSTPEGISISELYNKMGEAGAGEREIKAAFFNLALTEGLYLDKDRKIKISSQG